MLKKIIASILSAELLITFVPSTVFAESTATVQNYTKSGQITTLVRDYDLYYLQKENYSSAGKLAGATTIEYLNEDEYQNILNNKEYDLVQSTIITTSINGTLINKGGARLYVVYSTQTVDGNYVKPSMIGGITNDYDSFATFSALTEKAGSSYSFLYSYNTYNYRATANKATGIIVLAPVDSDTFLNLKTNMMDNNILFYRDVDINDKTYSDIVYDQSDSECITIARNVTNIGITIEDVANGKQYNDTSAALSNEATEGYDASRYGENYEPWSDEYNEGYTGTWQDPIYIGEKEVIEWHDPFWLSSTVKESQSSNGYYDDYGNFIKTDTNGNVLPKVPGTFDADGNFKPADVTGYYDIYGRYHFESIPLDGAKLSEDGKLYIENSKYSGYFDTDGSWHQAGATLSYTHYNGGIKISQEGSVYLSDGTYSGKATANLWGTFFFDNKIYYPDSSVFSLSSYTLTDIDGNVMIAQITEYGNYKFSDGSVIINNYNYIKGKKTGSNGIELDNGTIYYEDKTIQYPTGDTYANGYLITADNKKVEAKFEYGKILYNGIIYFEQGLVAEADEFGNYFTDSDALILSDFRYLLANGYILENTKTITAAYIDGNQNLIATSGIVFNRMLQEGYYDNNGQFHVGVKTGLGYYDRLGNLILNGSIVTDGSAQYYDAKGQITDVRPENDSYYTCDGIKISNEEQIFDRNAELGYYDEFYNYILNNGEGMYDNEGTFYPSVEIKPLYNNESGMLTTRVKTNFVIDADGSLYIPGYDAKYKGDGLFILDGRTGYYNANGKFIISESNSTYLNGGFRGPDGNWYDAKLFYTDNAGRQKTVVAPELGLKIENDTIITSTGTVFDATGITNDGYYNNDGVFITSQKSPFAGGFYDDAGAWIDKKYFTVGKTLCCNNGYFTETGSYVTPFGDYGYFNESGTFILNKINPFEAGFYDMCGNFYKFEDYIFRDVLGNYRSLNSSAATASDGHALTTTAKQLVEGTYKYLEHGTYLDMNNNVGHFNQTRVFLAGVCPYTDGFYNSQGMFIEYGEVYFPEYTLMENEIYIRGIAYTNYTAKTVSFFMLNNIYIDAVTGETFDVTGTCFRPDGTYGYYNRAGEFNQNYSNPYINGFYRSGAQWVATSNGSPIKGTFNQYGIPRLSNINADVFYDFEGTAHIPNNRTFYEMNGTFHTSGKNAFAYFDIKGNLHIEMDSGYYGTDGNHYTAQNKLEGYYSADGKLIKGKNPNSQGFYDRSGNWYLFGDYGYFDVNGAYHESVTDEKIGYFTRSGEFINGYNVYNNGYYTENGEWISNADLPQVTYFDVNGNENVGTIPYTYGFYDMCGYLHKYNDLSGYFDQYGSWHNTRTEKIGYYDTDGVLLDGTNIYQIGFYDENSNFHIFGCEGYYKKDGTYVDAVGKEWYFVAGGVKKPGTNNNEKGYYDNVGNWYDFSDKTVYYTADGIKKNTVTVIDCYNVSNDQYILFEGYFKNTEYPLSFTKNTVQFSVSGMGKNNRYIDTGIKVGTNAVLTYDKAQAILHSIAVYYGATYVENNGYCMVVYKGKFITITNDEYISIRELKEKFAGSDMQLIVAKSRVGGKYALAEMIESNQAITIYLDGEKQTISNPLISDQGVPYISLTDLSSLSDYDIIVKTVNGSRVIYGTLKNDCQLSASDYTAFSVAENNNKMIVTKNDIQGYMYIASDIKSFEEINGEIYVPAGEAALFTNKYVILDTYSITLNFVSTNQENVDFSDTTGENTNIVYMY